MLLHVAFICEGLERHTFSSCTMRASPLVLDRSWLKVSRMVRQETSISAMQCSGSTGSRCWSRFCLSGLLELSSMALSVSFSMDVTSPRIESMLSIAR